MRQTSTTSACRRSPTPRSAKKTVDFVTYFSAGESLIVAKGNPKNVTGPDLSLCGLTIAVEKGTTEESEVPALSKACTDGGKTGSHRTVD